MKRLIIVAIALFSINLSFSQNAQVVKYKSLFTYNFMRYVNWPEASKQGDFVIGVLKNSNLAEAVKRNIQGKKFGFQNIVVKEFNKVEEISDCQMLYVGSGSNYNKHSPILVEKLKSSNTLIITEDKGSIENGSMINFLLIDNTLKFEISVNNAKNFGLGFSSSLLAMNNAIMK